MSPLPPEWQNFFVAELGALAALTGLVVVAISINLSRILTIAHLPNRAGEALIVLVGALVVDSVTLVPNQPAVLLGVETTAIGLLTFVAPTINQVRSWSALGGVNVAKKYSRLLVSSAATLPFVIAGADFLVGSSAGFYWLAGGIIVSLVAGVWNSWILLVEILR